jgi:hypothetical protein
MRILGFNPSPASVNDLARIGEGRQAELFVWPPGGVLKLFRRPQDASAQREAGTMDLLASTGIPMPRLLGTVTIEQRPGIIMERLEGADQLSQLGREPWRIWAVAKTLGRLHARLHSTVVPEGLRPLRSSIREEIEHSDSVPSGNQDSRLCRPRPASRWRQGVSLGLSPWQCDRD